MGRCRLSAVLSRARATHGLRLPWTTLYAYTEARLELVEFSYGRFYHGVPGSSMRFADKFIVLWCRRNHVVYEHYFAHTYPMHDITYRLKVNKTP
jgi:hypothetical protein